MIVYADRKEIVRCLLFDSAKRDHYKRIQSDLLIGSLLSCLVLECILHSRDLQLLWPKVVQYFETCNFCDSKWYNILSDETSTLIFLLVFHVGFHFSLLIFQILLFLLVSSRYQTSIRTPPPCVHPNLIFVLFFNFSYRFLLRYIFPSFVAARVFYFSWFCPLCEDVLSNSYQLPNDMHRISWSKDNATLRLE